MKQINIGGVPEHFNLAWYLGLKHGEYKDAGINLRWKDYFGGTGAMNKGLRDGDIDMAVILTEGIVKDIISVIFSHNHIKVGIFSHFKA